MDKSKMRNYEKELKSLGILNIEADGNFSEALIEEAIDAVKQTNINFKSIAEQAEKMVVPIK